MNVFVVIDLETFRLAGYAAGCVHFCLYYAAGYNQSISEVLKVLFSTCGDFKNTLRGLKKFGINFEVDKQTYTRHWHKFGAT